MTDQAMRMPDERRRMSDEARCLTKEGRTDTGESGAVPFRVMRMDETHIPAAAGIERLCFSQPWSEKAFRLLLGEQGVGYVVQNCEGRTVAYAGMVLAPDEGQIANVAVHPDFRRAGAGRAVLRALIADAKERGLGQLSLEVRVSNAAARALYRSEGFAEAGIPAAFLQSSGRGCGG